MTLINYESLDEYRAYIDAARYLGLREQDILQNLAALTKQIHSRGYIETPAFKGVAFGYSDISLEKIVAHLKERTLRDYDFPLPGSLVEDTLRAIAFLYKQNLPMKKYFSGEPFHNSEFYHIIVLGNQEKLLKEGVALCLLFVLNKYSKFQLFNFSESP